MAKKLSIRVHEATRDTFTDEQKDLFANALKQQGIRQPLITIEDTQIIFKSRVSLSVSFALGMTGLALKSSRIKHSLKSLSP